jgi:hypothetical protein
MNVYDRATGGVFSRLSRFIDGISEEILEPWSLVGEAAWDEDAW